MNQSNRVLNLLSILLPLIILAILGGYFSYTTLGKYVTISELQHRLESVVLLKSLEDKISQEVICTTKALGGKGEIKDYCSDSRMASDRIVEEISNLTTKTPFYKQIDALVFDNNKTAQSIAATFFGEQPLATTLQSIRYNFDTSQDFRIDKLTDGEYQKWILYPINRYWQEARRYSDSYSRPYIDFFIDINQLYSNSVKETIFVAFFLAKKIPFSTNELTQWDYLMAKSEMPDIQKRLDVDAVREPLELLFSSNTAAQLLNYIDQAGVNILLSHDTGNYQVTVQQWIDLNRNKQSLLMQAQSMILEHLSKQNLDTIKNYEMIIIGGLTIALLSIFIFVSMTLSFVKRSKEEDEALNKMMRDIEELTTESKKEVLSSEGIIHNFGNKKQMYNYIDSILKLLHEKELQAGEAVYAKDLFLANMSHEIRTPLNGIVGFTQLLKESPLTPDQREYINIIENSSDNLLTIVNDILDLSKISANKMELENVGFDLFEKAESAIETFVAKADEKNIELGIYLDPTLPRYLIGDPTKLSQVIINLISNALKFTPTHGTIDLKIEKTKPNNSEFSGDFTTIRFSVKDSGIGISSEQKKKIFQAFTQADSSTNRKYGGTGLGLTISQAIIDYMGGALDVISEENQGAEFYFIITLENDPRSRTITYPNLEKVTVGCAVPNPEYLQQSDVNLRTYIEYLKCSFNYYSYTEIFENNSTLALPEILFVDTRDIKDVNELKIFEKLKTKVIFISTSAFKSKIGSANLENMQIMHKPINLSKVSRNLENILQASNQAPFADGERLKTDKFSNIKALVAEDNTINQKLILATLENFGMKVTITSNGKEALEARQKEDYDIIFMDVQMPILSGIEATQAILEYEAKYNVPHIPVIALTANALKGDREKYMSAGMDNYASKPLDLTQLKEIIHTYFPDGEPTRIHQTPPLVKELQDQSQTPEEPAVISDASPISMLEPEEPQELEVPDGIESQNVEPLEIESMPIETFEIESLEIPIANSNAEESEFTQEENLPVTETQEEVIEDEISSKQPLESNEITILLYNKMALQSNIYRSIFKGLGYEVVIAKSDDDFLDKLENGKFSHALFDLKNFNDMSCSVADIVKDAGAEPIILVDKIDDTDFCAQRLTSKTDRETIKKILQNL